MKRLAAILAIALFAAAPASADTLASQVGAEAARLLSHVSTAEKAARSKPSAKATQLAPELQSDLQRFGLTARRLSSEIDQLGGPTDLRCIFRGMSDETSKQLTAAAAAKSNADQAMVLARLVHMLKDATEIAPAVDDGKATAANSSRAAAVQCPAVKKF